MSNKGDKKQLEEKIESMKNDLVKRSRLLIASGFTPQEVEEYFTGIGYQLDRTKRENYVNKE